MIPNKNVHPIVYVVIVNYNGEYWIRKCLDSIKASRYLVETVVVDNNSVIDESVKIIENEYPEVILILNQKNLGFGSANNIGISKALNSNADYIFLLNQDAWIEFDTIERLVDIAEHNQEFGIISPIHLASDKSSLDYAFSTYIDAKKCPNLISDLFTHNLKSIYPLPFVNAAGWLISKSCLEKTGGFDSGFFMYGEDLDYCNRVHYHGFKIGVIPDATICHGRNYSSFKIQNYLSEKEKNIIIANDRAFLKDINHSLLSQVGIWFTKNTLLFLKDILNAYFIRAIGLLVCNLTIVLKIGSIIKSRSDSKKTKAFL